MTAPSVASIIPSPGKDTRALFSWRECLSPVFFFRVVTTRVEWSMRYVGISHIESSTSSNPCDCYIGPNQFIFAPVEGEMVIGVDVHYTHSQSINAIRFITNEQTTPWFGELTGPKQSYRAPSDFYIHAFAGYELGSTGRLYHLDAVLWPRVSPQTALAAGRFEYSNHELIAHSLDATPDAVAFIIETNNGAGLRSITALSPPQWRGYEALYEGLQFPKADQVVHLLKNEKVIGVQYMKQDTSVTAVRFQTNRRTTPWIGAHVANAVQHTVDLGDLPKDAYICGFQAPETGAMKSVDVVYWVPKAP